MSAAPHTLHCTLRQPQPVGSETASASMAHHNPSLSSSLRLFSLVACQVTPFPKLPFPLLIEKQTCFRGADVHRPQTDMPRGCAAVFSSLVWMIRGLKPPADLPHGCTDASLSLPFACMIRRQRPQPGVPHGCAAILSPCLLE